MISLGLSQSVYAQAFPGIPGTEDFSSDALEGPATTAEWDNTVPHVLRLPLSTSTDPVESLNTVFGTSVNTAVDAADDLASRAVAIGDLNGDGFPDLAFGNAGPNSVYFNNQSGAFVRGSDVPDDFPFGGGGNTRSVVIADLNGDGHLDVVFAEFGGAQETRVHFNNGSGTMDVFDDGDFVDLGPASLKGDSLAVGDVDDDNDTDVVLGIRGGYVRLFLNDGFGNFSDPISVDDSGVASSGFHARSVALGDLDRDGDLDLVAALEFGSTRVYLNDGSGDFTASSTQSAAGGAINKLSAPDSIALGDVNNDGRLDLIIGNDGSDSDLDNDGDPATNPGIPNRIYLGGPSASDVFPAVSFEFSDSANTNVVRLADIDRDGDLDIITGDLVDLTTPDTNRIYVNDGAGNFPANGAAITADTKLTKSIAIGDLNADGKLDLVIVNDLNGSPPGSGINQIVLNTGIPSGSASDQLFATATSLQVDNGEDLSNGLLLVRSHDSVIANPMFTFWLSSNGGLRWVTVEPGRSIGFPTPIGNDLRWRVEMNTPSPDATFWRTEIDSLTITVNRSPRFTSTEVTDATQDVLYSYAITTPDSDSEAVSISSTTALPAWLTLTDNGDLTATLEGTPTNDDVGDHNVELEVIDGAGASDTQAFTITVANVNDAPTAVAPTIDQMFSQGDTVDLDASAAFQDIDGDTMTYSAVGLPASLIIDAVTGIISGTLTNDDVINGPDYTVTVTADDGNGGTGDDVFAISITDVNDAPSFTSTAILVATEDTAYSYNITVTDGDGDAIAITSGALPGWLTFTDNGDGTATLTGTPVAADAGNVAVMLIADDGLAQTPQDFTIVVATVPEPTPTPKKKSGGGSFGVPYLLLLAGFAMIRRRRQR